MTEVSFTHKVLVVDDELGIIRLCQRLLERAGFKVVAFSEPDEGAAYLELEHVDLLLVDIRMPELDGFQLIDLSRRRQPDLAVVVMTGFGTVDTAIEALRRGADGLILKPFSGVELVQTVKRAIQDNQRKQDVLRLQTLRPLFAIAEALFRETNPDRLQGLLLDSICGHLHCEHAGFYQLEGAGGRFKLVHSRGSLQAEEDSDAEGSLFGRLDVWEAPILVNAEGPGDATLQSMLTKRGLGSWMAAPLRGPAGLTPGLGVLVAARDRGEPVFRDPDQEMFAILSHQAEVALDNARLNAELRAYIRQVENSQRALIQAEKVAISGRLTATIAHEINNPLQAVQNCLHLAGRKELTVEERQEYLGMAQSELERLMITVHRMLDYYRPSAVDRKPVDLNDETQQVLALVERQLADHGIHVKARFAKKLPLTLGVSDQIRQVLLNLILNAMEAMPDGGTLYIETFAEKDHVSLTIEDTGPGIPLDQRERIFEPFVSTKEGGTGLGLAVSYGIVSAHGGSLDLVQSRSKGACFRMTLPVGEGL